MASAAGNQAIDPVETIFDATNDGGKCRAFRVYVGAASGNPLDVNVESLHQSNEYMRIAAGQGVTFELRPNGIAKVHAKGSGGEATAVDYGVVARGSD